MTSATGDRLSYEEPVRRYNRTAMILHWLVAALLLVNVVYGLEAANADDAHVRPLIDMHKSIGLTLLGLVALRILWRLGHKPPPMPSRYPALERKGAHFAHLLLYAVMLLLPLTGYIHDSAWKLAASHPIELYGLVPFPPHRLRRAPRRRPQGAGALAVRCGARLARLRALRFVRPAHRRRAEAPRDRP